MPEPGEVAREASQRNLPGYQRHQLQTHHARVIRPGRRRTTPLLGLLCSSWVLTGAGAGALSAQHGREEERRDKALQAPTRLISTPSSATSSRHRPPTLRSSSTWQELPGSGTRTLVPQQAGRQSGPLHTRDAEPAASPASPTDGEAGQHHRPQRPQPRSRPSISQKQKPAGKAKKPKDAPGSEASHPEQGRQVEKQRVTRSGTGGRAGLGPGQGGTGPQQSPPALGARAGLGAARHGDGQNGTESTRSPL